MIAHMTENWFKDNEANWDDRSAVHVASGYGIDELLANDSTISDEIAQDIHRFGDLSQKDIIHLQCHIGTDTIGFKRRGAQRVVGVDLSNQSLTYARDLADRAGVPIEYIHANVYDARQAVTGMFDVVYTAIGVLCWLPDIDEWAQVVASLMKPGGMFFIRDDHPMFMTIADVAPGSDAPLIVEQPYFQQEEPLTWEDETSYVTAENAPQIQNTRNHQWNHSLGEIISALINAGLQINQVEEVPYSAWCPWPDLMVKEKQGWRLRDHPERMPLQFTITATKPK